jgi:hypothetical protein
MLLKWADGISFKKYMAELTLAAVCFKPAVLKQQT